uniref:hypothetical protein n=1 Tax=Streptomyces canus TaxID=58343 RepID=UPI00358F5CD5
MSAALTLTLLQAAPALGDDDAREQRRPKTQDVPSTPVVEEGGQVTPLKHLAGYGSSRAPKASWPKPGSATVVLDGGRAPRSIKAGGLPVRIAAAQARSVRAATPARATVDVLGHDAARKAGIDGLLLKVTNADARTSLTTAAAPAKVSVEVDYASFAQAYGGDWAQRLRLVELPACALATPKAAACQTVTPLATDNDVRAQKLTAAVPATVGAKAPLLAVSAAPSGGSGSYTATSLAPSASWQVATQTGAFTWQYPLRVPPAIAGPSPQLGLAYNSASTDGRTASSNNQTSWVGEGFDLSAGYIERSYRSCTEDGHDEAGSQKYDLCWHSDNATMNFGGRAGELVKKAQGRVASEAGRRHDRRAEDRRLQRRRQQRVLGRHHHRRHPLLLRQGQARRRRHRVHRLLLGGPGLRRRQGRALPQGHLQGVPLPADLALEPRLRRRRARQHDDVLLRHRDQQVRHRARRQGRLLRPRWLAQADRVRRAGGQGELHRRPLPGRIRHCRALQGRRRRL